VELNTPVPRKLPRQICPICAVEVEYIDRYPRYVCGACCDRAKSADGRVLTFGDVIFENGAYRPIGYHALYMDTGEPHDSHECFIDGIRCLADQAHFGGIVIAVADMWSSMRIVRNEIDD